jgi:hypothetical protein
MRNQYFISRLLFASLFCLFTNFVRAQIKPNFNSIEEAVVLIMVYDQNKNLIGHGSGFMIDKNGTVVTNYHVIKDAYYLKVRIRKDNNDVEYDVGTIISGSQSIDLVTLSLKIPPGINFPYLRLAKFPPNKGEDCWSIGTPADPMYMNTVSQGVISNLNLELQPKILQTSAQIAHGSSGGALINSKGEVIGVTSGGDGSEDGIRASINFAIWIGELSNLNKINKKTIAATASSTSQVAFYTNNQNIGEVYLYLDGLYIGALNDYVENNYTPTCGDRGTFSRTLKSGTYHYDLFIKKTGNWQRGKINLAPDQCQIVKIDDFSSINSDKQSYRISIKYSTEEAKKYVYLGYHFGDKKYLQDSALIDQSGNAVFQGNKPLTGGLYILVDPEKARFFDVVIDQHQQFSVEIDTAFSLVKISGSKENDELQAYQKINNLLFKDFEKWREDLKLAKTKEDSLPIQQKMNGAFEKAQKWRDSFTLANPAAFLSLMFQLMREPEYKVEGSQKQDTLNAIARFKDEYWKDISISDIRMLRTPVFESRLTKYMDQVVYRHPDSLKQEIDRFILYSRTDTTMFKYYISRFTNEYMASKYMGLDVVFLHLFQKYYLGGQVTWLNEKDSTLIYNRAYNIMGNIIGEPAAELKMLDKDDRPTNLYSIASPYTLVVFWDPDCGHCREQVPKIDSLYHSHLKKAGVTIVGVLVDTIRSDKSKWPAVKSKWTDYIKKHKLGKWIHLYQPFDMREEERRKNIPNFRQNYDVYQTPTIYLLDKDKRIVAKKITPEQVQDFMEFQEKQNKIKN